MTNSSYILKRKKAREVAGAFMPQLTSLIDVMTILLVFLIRSFSAEGNLVTSSSNLELPESVSKNRPKPAATIEVTKTAIVSEDGVLVRLGDLGDGDSLVIPAVYEWIAGQASKTPSESKSREVMIQADKEIEFRIIKRIMFSCSSAGYSDFTILVMEES